MISEQDIYWLTRMDELKSLTSLLAFASAMATLSIFMIFGFAFTEISTKAKYLLFGAFSFFVGLCVFLTSAYHFIPTTKEMAAIKVIPMIANNKELKGLGEDVVVLAKEWVQELKPKKPDVKAEKQ